VRNDIPEGSAAVHEKKILVLKCGMCQWETAKMNEMKRHARVLHGGNLQVGQSVQMNHHFIDPKGWTPQGWKAKPLQLPAPAVATTTACVPSASKIQHQPVAVASTSAESSTTSAAAMPWTGAPTPGDYNTACSNLKMASMKRAGLEEQLRRAKMEEIKCKHVMDTLDAAYWKSRCETKEAAEKRETAYWRSKCERAEALVRDLKGAKNEIKEW